MRRCTHLESLLSVIFAITLSAQVAAANESNDAFFSDFAQHVEATENLDAKGKAIIADAIGQRNEDSDDESLLVEALVLMSPVFAQAMDAYDDEDYAACVEKLSELADADDPYVRMNARAYAARALVHLNTLVEAQQRIEAMLAGTDDLRRFTLAEPELRYMLGYCQVQNLDYAAARETLERFLRDFPNASPRLVVTAKQMLAELARRIPDGIGEVADLMTFSEQRLAAADATDRVRDAQTRIVDLLDDLIEQVEEMEKQQQQNPSSSQSQSPKPQPKPKPDQPPDEPQPQQATGSEQPKTPGRQVSPGDAWGALPEAQRQRILQVLRDRFPGRYRALVEQYYESLAQEP